MSLEPVAVSKSPQARVARPAAEAANRVWAMDFLGDALSDGRRFRALTVVDTYTREGRAARTDLFGAASMSPP